MAPALRVFAASQRSATRSQPQVPNAWVSISIFTCGLVSPPQNRRP